MKKGQKPSAHYRVVKTSKGYRRIPVNLNIRKKVRKKAKLIAEKGADKTMTGKLVPQKAKFKTTPGSLVLTPEALDEQLGLDLKSVDYSEAVKEDHEARDMDAKIKASEEIKDLLETKEFPLLYEPQLKKAKAALKKEKAEVELLNELRDELKEDASFSISEQMTQDDTIVDSLDEYVGRKNAKFENQKKEIELNPTIPQDEKKRKINSITTSQNIFNKNFGSLSKEAQDKLDLLNMSKREMTKLQDKFGKSHLKLESIPEKEKYKHVTLDALPQGKPYSPFPELKTGYTEGKKEDSKKKSLIPSYYMHNYYDLEAEKARKKIGGLLNKIVKAKSADKDKVAEWRKEVAELKKGVDEQKKEDSKRLEEFQKNKREHEQELERIKNKFVNKRLKHFNEKLSDAGPDYLYSLAGVDDFEREKRPDLAKEKIKQKINELKTDRRIAYAKKLGYQQ